MRKRNAGRAAQRRHIIQQCHVAAQPEGRFSAAFAALRGAVPCAVACHAAVDAETWLPVTHWDDRGAARHLEAAWANEYLTPDFNKLRALARTAPHVGVLSRVTGGEPWRSPRFQQLLRHDAGLEHELRAALVSNGVLWGYVALLRPPEMPDFSAGEAALVAAVAPHLAEAQRSDQLAAVRGKTRKVRAPGVLLLDAQSEAHSTTREAEELLEELGQAMRAGQRLPDVVYFVAAAAGAVGLGALEPGVVPHGRLMTPSGQWLLIHGSLLQSSAGARHVAITIEPAPSSETASLLVQAYDLTRRERDVLLLVLRGLATQEIPRRLCVSAYTVQDHLKAIFDKAGVRSRRDLVAAVFYRHGPAVAET